ncbi:MAG TPA: DUF5924 family protein [Acidobacteriota bacterium]|nr:DUF5924 family protein [Acidobacteriota bacterium]
MPDSPNVSETPTAIGKTSLRVWFQRHKDKIWWLHSLYALGFGIGIMWLGARNYNYLRVTVFHVGFIWLSSLYLPKLLDHPRLSARWAVRLRWFINYFNKNFYQQVLFFVLPIYYASATPSAANFVFVLLLGISAILSTLDLVYDRHLAARQSLTAAFFAFNLFALINVMLPVLWSISNLWTTRISGLLAGIAFASLYRPIAKPRRLRIEVGLLTIVTFLAVAEYGRSFIPPAPLRLVSAEFGGGFDREAMRAEPVLRVLEVGRPARVWGVTAVRAPLGLRDEVQHRWFQNGRLIWASPFYDLTGGREQGFRLWTAYTFATIAAGTELRLDVETEGGQLIGRAKLRAAR